MRLRQGVRLCVKLRDSPQAIGELSAGLLRVCTNRCITGALSMTGLPYILTRVQMCHHRSPDLVERIHSRCAKSCPSKNQRKVEADKSHRSPGRRRGCTVNESTPLPPGDRLPNPERAGAVKEHRNSAFSKKICKQLSFGTCGHRRSDSAVRLQERSLPVQLMARRRCSSKVPSGIAQYGGQNTIPVPYIWL